MKHSYLYLNIVIVLAIGFLFFMPSNNNEVRKYTPRGEQSSNSKSAQGAFEYLMSIRANQETGTIDVEDVIAAQKQLKILKSRKSGGSEWISRGPDNIGGRTRALLIDKDNSNLMFAGGVAGGLWKSTTAGQYWEKVEYEGANTEDFANLAIVSICQAANGDIYFGTGEAFSWNHGTNGSTPMIMGAGIWKSSNNGQTFSMLESTWATSDDKNTFSAVNKMAADPTNPNLIYAATRKGLKVTNDGGETWGQAPMESSIYDNAFASDVKIATDGSVIVSIRNHCLVQKAGTSEFVKRSGADESNGGNLITSSDVGRLEFAYSLEDPNYVFCIAANQSGYLRKIYKSTDGGDNWVIIGNGGSALFQPLGDQGGYDLCIAVNPINKDEVFIGGIDLWVGNSVTTGDLFAWDQITLWNLWVTHPNYVHADLHTIIFDPKEPQTMFIGSDGGVSRGFLNKDNIPFQFRTMNKNYNVTQFYSIAVNSRGNLLGGTQDNGSLIITGEGNTESNAKEVLGGDGGHAVMSQIMPNIAYATIYWGGLWRNNDKDYYDWNTFYSPDIAKYQNWGSGTWESEKREAAFITPITYWETDNDEFNDNDELIMLEAKMHYPADTTVVFPSHNVNKAPITITLDKEYNIDDTIYYRDPYRALFALGMKRNLWITRKAANWNTTGFAARDWWLATKTYTLSNDEEITQMRFSTDGDHLFFSTSDQDIYRLSNLNMVRTFDEADYIFGTNIITELTKIGNSGGQTVTGIAVDPNNANNIIVTLGNYSESRYVYLCTKAAYATESSSLSNFTNITGELPHMPVYCALFEKEEGSKRVLLGTDMGVFMTENLFEQVSSTQDVDWTPMQDGMGPVPVFQITQLTYGGNNNGVIYVGTHGNGFFENRTYLSIDDEKPEGNASYSEELSLSIYPNPIENNAKVSVNLYNSGNVVFEVINLSGQVIRKFDMGYMLKGENKVDIALGDLKQGVYLIKINSQNNSGAARFIKK